MGFTITVILLFFAMHFAEGYEDSFGKWMECPEGYSNINGTCYRTKMCAEGYFLHSDGMCHLIQPLPCPHDANTTTSTETPISSTATESIEEGVPMTTTQLPPSSPEKIEPSDELVRCPPGSIFFEDQCRKIRCSQGEYYAGRCLFPTCPTGTVWFDKKCQPPGYITTILEINNVFKNSHEYHAVTENINKVDYVTINSYDSKTDESHVNSKPSNQVVVTTRKPAQSFKQPSAGCCTVKSPRICRPYPPKWVCFNQRQLLCDPRICTSPVIYLKPPKIVELSDPPLLIMPPNPPLSGCRTADCHESEILDCSGCAKGQREYCSAACYNYFCPDKSCEFKKSEYFCSLYPGGFGCNKNYGCIWNWCT